MQLMRGFNERSPGSSSGEAKKEGMPYYMEAFLAIALDWRTQAKTKAIEMQTLQALKREVATLKGRKAEAGKRLPNLPGGDPEGGGSGHPEAARG